MKKGWLMKRLGEVVEYVKNQNLHKGLPYVGLEHIESNTGTFLGNLEPQEVKSSTFYFTEENVLYGRLRPYLNKVFLPNFKGHCSTEIFPIKVKKELVREFLFYWLIREEIVKKIDATWTGARMPRANMNQVLEFDFAFPPLPEQKRIVATLDQCFTAIDKAKANAEQSLKNAKELFESYLQEVFGGKGKEWEMRKLGECFKFKSGDMLSAKMMQKGKIPVYGGNGISGYHNEFNLQGENVIVGRVGALCGNVRFIDEKIWLTDNAFLITDYKFVFDKPFLTYLLNYKDLRNYARQAAQPVISNSSLNDVLISFPKSLKEQQAIVRQLDALRAETQKLEAVYQKKLADLEEMKKSILQKAFAGELK